jgi:serine/threonine protein kinase
MNVEAHGIGTEVCSPLFNGVRLGQINNPKHAPGNNMGVPKPFPALYCWHCVCRHMDVDQLLCRRSLTPLEILTIMQHTVLALYDLAVARLVHADVKPPNVLVCDVINPISLAVHYSAQADAIHKLGMLSRCQAAVCLWTARSLSASAPSAAPDLDSSLVLQVMLDENGQVATAHLTDFGSVQFVAPGLQVAPAIW